MTAFAVAFPAARITAAMRSTVPCAPFRSSRAPAARAVPARNTYDSDLPQKSASAKKKASNSGSLLQRAKQKFAPKKKYRKVPEIKQLPLPPAPKKRYSQAVPTGFEQPDEDSNEAFLKAMESDEELF